MDGGMCILQVRGVRPFMSKKYDITKHPLYKQLGDYDKQNKFNVEEFLSTDLKVRPDDTYEVIEVDLPDAPPEAFVDMPVSIG